MSNKKAQRLADQIEEKYGIYLASYQNEEIVSLRDSLDEFLALDVSTDDLEANGDEIDTIEDLFDDPEAEEEELE